MAELVLVGCYTSVSGGKGTGIGRFWRDPATGALTPAGEFELDSPSWLTWHPSLPVVYAANETSDGAVTALAVDPAGELSVLGTLPSGGADPCQLAITPDGRHLLCANYSGGSLAVFGLDEQGLLTGRTDLVQHEGSGPDADRQEAAHVHMAVAGPDGLVSAVDLGTDEIRSYRLSEDGKLTALSVSKLPPGTGPRQLVRRPGTDLAYVVGELAANVLTVREGPAGTFTVVGTAPATVGTYPKNLVAHLEVTPDGLYLSNREPDCLTTFAFDGDTVRPLADLPSGKWPRHFSLAGGHAYVAAQSSHAVVTFPLSAPDQVTAHPIGTPSCVVVTPRLPTG